MRALSNAVEARDAYTGKHAERVAAYGIELARETGLDVADSPQIEFGFLLHDVGKVGVPDAILFKSSALTQDEYALVKGHPVIGSEILRDVDFLGEGKLVVRHHHERWDGTGYPDGLGGEAIPLAARVFAVADALDALTTDRPYRPASTFAAAREEIRAGSGTQFDPAVIAAYEADPRRRSSSGSATACRDPHHPHRRRRPRHPPADRHDARGRLGLPDDGGGRRRGGARAGARRPPGDRLPRHRHAAPERDRGLPPDALGARHRRRDDRHAHRDSDDGAERDARAAGADLFLTKPFSPLHLLRLVDRLGERP